MNSSPKLDALLRRFGVRMSGQEFREEVWFFFSATYGRRMTDEDLLFQPKRSRRFCRLIRDVLGNDAIPDEVILREMVNFRKSSARRRLLAQSTEGVDAPSPQA